MSPARTRHSEEERAQRKDRVQAAKTALHDSSKLTGAHVPAARSALKNYLRQLNESNQPNDAMFQHLLAAPFAVPRPRR
jgi:hypothetical protein